MALPKIAQHGPQLSENKNTKITPNESRALLLKKNEPIVENVTITAPIAIELASRIVLTSSAWIIGPLMIEPNKLTRLKSTDA
ncbi:hypothetical protein G9P44_000815 [Scheffersomyces stipitis]|nr:hypothetical protein G9P44_000815 [Scheffersomyces stipitis]